MDLTLQKTGKHKDEFLLRKDDPQKMKELDQFLNTNIEKLVIEDVIFLNNYDGQIEVRTDCAKFWIRLSEDQLWLLRSRF